MPPSASGSALGVQRSNGGSKATQPAGRCSWADRLAPCPRLTHVPGAHGRSPAGAMWKEGAVTGVKPSGFGFPNTWEETRPGSFPRAGPQPLFQHILSKDELRAGEHFSQTLNSKSQLGMSYKYSENRGRYKARFTTQQDEKVFQRKGHEMRAPDRFLGDRDSAGTARPPTRPRAALWALQEGAGLFRGLPFQGNAE